MTLGPMMRAMFAAVGVVAIGAGATTTFAAESKKPKEIVVVGSKATKAKGSKIKIDCEGHTYLGQSCMGK